MDLISKAKFAERAAVSRAAVSKATAPGGSLAPAMNGTKLDAHHRSARAYLERNGQQAPDGRSNGTHRRGGSIEKDKRKAGGEQLPMPDLSAAQNIADFLEYPLRDIVTQFATDVRFVDWLKAVKEIENIRDKRLRNDEREGQYLPRDIFDKVIAEFDRCFTLLLRDTVKTVSAQVHAESKAGGSPAESMETIEDLVGAPITDAKKRIGNWLEAYKHDG